MSTQTKQRIPTNIITSFLPHPNVACRSFTDESRILRRCLGMQNNFSARLPALVNEGMLKSPLQHRGYLGRDGRRRVRGGA
eukprot:2620378-Pyramimonas_sp.AAC.2